MGVSGLLVLLKSIQKPCHLRKFAGLTLGVDAYGWLHPGTIPCAVDLALGKPTTKYIEYAMHRVRMLVHFGITPYIVFDGNYLPSKAGTETKRAESRAEARRKGLELLRLGKGVAAQQELQKAVDVTPEMAKGLIEELRKIGVKYVVAPYEADAQMAYMERKGIIQGIVSEDSDLLVFGAKRLITKLDRYGECIEINRDDFTACKAVSFIGWTDDMFRRMAIMSGCDYLAGIDKMGLKTAHNLVRRYKDIDRIIKVIQFSGRHKLSTEYLECYKKAELTFLHQWVFCPLEQKLVMGHNWPIEARPDDISFIGEDLDIETAVGIATGDLHPMTRLPLQAHAKVTKSKDRKHNVSSAPRQSILQTPEIKAYKKPIDTFFKPNRTPLAELDPNCFSPSPSQQNLLRRAPAILRSTPVDENNTPMQSVAASASAARSTGAIRLSRKSSNHSSLPRTIPHPPKRQRLCDDSPRKDKTNILETSPIRQSKFFGPRLPDSSPTIGRRIRKKDKNLGFNIHSDDSIEDTMLSLPDTSELGVSPRKLAVFQDLEPGKIVDQTSANIHRESNSQASVITAESTISPMFSTSTSMTSAMAADATSTCEVPSTPPLASRIDEHVRADLAALRQKYIFDTAEKAPLPSTKHPSPAFLRQRPSTDHHLSATPKDDSDTSAQVEVEVEVFPSDSIVAESPVKPREERMEKSLPNWRFGSIRATRIAALCGQSVEAADSQGSEDAFVPDSEGEGEDGEEELALVGSSAMNLGRFAFTG